MQHFGQNLRWRLEVEALARCVIVKEAQVVESIWVKRSEVGLTRQMAAQPTDGVFDSALLPRGMWIAEKGANVERLVQRVVQSELRAVVEGDCSPQLPGQRSEQL